MQTQEVDELVIIAGAGPVGCAAGLLLLKSPSAATRRTVWILEKRADHRVPTAAGAGELRSINLALSARGLQTLEALNLKERALSKAVEMFGRAVHKDGGPEVTNYQAYDDVHGRSCIYSVSRRDVNDLLLEEFEKQDKGKVFFNEFILTAVRRRDGLPGLTLTTNTGRTIQCRALLGCDGAHSSTRDLASRLQPTNFSRTYIDHGYMELRFPPLAGGSEFTLDREKALHIWPRGDGIMMIALPNVDGSFTGTVFASGKLLLSFDSDDKAFEEFMAREFGRVVPLLDARRGKAHPLFYTNVSPWTVSDGLVLLGDAAHAQVPFFGQGMNAGLQDALEFVKVLDSECNGDWKRALGVFETRQSPNGRAITQLSLDNYIDMHSHSSSRFMLLQRRAEGWLARLTKERFLPLYYAVSFTTKPYAGILRGEGRADVALSRWFTCTSWGAVALTGVAALYQARALLEVKWR